MSGNLGKCIENVICVVFLQKTRDPSSRITATLIEITPRSQEWVELELGTHRCFWKPTAFETILSTHCLLAKPKLLLTVAMAIGIGFPVSFLLGTLTDIQTTSEKVAKKTQQRRKVRL